MDRGVGIGCRPVKHLLQGFQYKDVKEVLDFVLTTYPRLHSVTFLLIESPSRACSRSSASKAAAKRLARRLP